MPGKIKVRSIWLPLPANPIATAKSGRPIATAPPPSTVHERKAARGETLDKLKYVGLRVVKQKSRDGKRMFVKLTAPQSRLEQEAERLEIDMKLSSRS